MKKHFALVVPFLMLTACGSGNDPMTLLGDPSVMPELALPLSSVNVIDPYSSTTEGFVFYAPITTPVLAPVSGVITDVNTSLDGNAVAITIVSNAEVYTRIRRLTSPSSLRVGDYVAANQQIGTFSTTSVIVSVYVDGTLKCPYSYFTQDARTSMNGHFSAVAICQ